MVIFFFFLIFRVNDDKARTECQIGKYEGRSVFINGSFKANADYLTHINAV